MKSFHTSPPPGAPFLRLLRIAGLLAVTAFAGNAAAQSMFRQKIPIQIPQGTHGLQPELALEYDPNLKNGIVGVGWHLTGLSVVTRVNFGNGVNYDGKDTYSHSTLGVLVPQSDGTYRTKKESFARLVPSGTCGDGPCSWVATDRSGVKFFYGTTADSQFRNYFGGRLSSMRTWALSKVLDLFGNYYEISYSKSAHDSEVYPRTITYTNGPANSSLRSISFDYELRSDTERRGSSIKPLEMNSRLKWISVFSAGALVRKYRLDYEYNTALTGRSHLIALQEYGSDGISTLPAQTFKWQQGGIGLRSSERGEDSRTGASTRLVGDFNGDGKMDIATVFNDAGSISFDVRVSQGGSFVTQRWATQQGGWLGGDSWQSYGTFLAGDFNGDGKTDIAYVFNDNGDISLDVHSSNGSAFVLERWATQQGGWIGGTSWQRQSLFLAGDFNGDGKSDIAYLFNDGGAVSIDVHASTGSGFVHQRWTTKNGSWVGGDAWQNSSTFLSGDFDGDGRMDVAYVYRNAAGQRSIGVYRSAGIATADSFYLEQWAGHPATAVGDTTRFRIWYGGDAWKDNSTYLTGDFNGDGITDIAYLFNDNNGISIEVEAANQGGFAVSRWASQQGGWIGGSDWRKKASFLAGDFDGDGKTDIGYVFLDSQDQYISIDVHAARPEGFVLQRWATNCAWSSGYKDWPQNAIFLATDFDGDGRTDIAQFDYSPAITTWKLLLFRSHFPSPDLMTTVKNGLGGTVFVSYAPAPQVQNAILPRSSGPGIPLTAPQQLVTSIETTDGNGGIYFTHYDYKDVRWYPGPISKQRYLGFSSIGVTNGRTSQVTRTTYYQDPGYEQHPKYTASYSSSGQMVDDAFFIYNLVNPSTGTELLRTSRIVKTTYENFTMVTRQETSLSDYDAYGNAKTVETTSGTLPVTVTTNYINDTAQWILGRVKDVTTSSNGTTLASMTNTWTGNLLTTRSDWLDVSGSWLDTTMEYYPNGDLKSVTQPSSDGLVRKTTTTYDPTFQAYPYTVTNALGHVTTTTYDLAGRPLTVTDPNGQVTSMTYDVFGRKSLETRPDGGTTDYVYGVNYITTFVMTSTSGASVSKTDYFDGSGFVFRSYTDGDYGKPICREAFKDQAGRLSDVNDPHPCALPANSRTHFTYDAAGRIATKTASDGTTTTFEYGVGYSAVIDPNGHKTTTYFDGKGRTWKVVDAAGQAVIYGYDAFDRPASVTLPDGSVTQITFDSLGRRTSVVDPKLGPTFFAYDDSGNVSSVLENSTGEGNYSWFTYDALNRVTSKWVYGSRFSNVTNTYDDPAIAYGKGRLTSVTGENETTTYSYKPNGMLNGFVRTVDGATYSQTFTYDLLGRVTHETYPDASFVDYSYTPAGNLEQVSLNGALVASWSGYNAAGQPGNVTFGNGVASALQYDAGYHVSALKTTNGSATLQDLTYDWYSRPNTKGLNLGAITDNRASKTVAGANTDESQTFSYDPLYRLREATGVWGTKSYDFDVLGNAKSFGGLVDRTLNYTGPFVKSGTGLSDVTYNGIGDVTHKVMDGTTWDYGWHAHRLEAVSKNGTQLASILYDSDGQRLKSVITPAGAPSMTALYIGKVYEKRTFDDGSPERHTLHIYANGQRIASVTRSGPVQTAFNYANGWRNELAAASMYSSTNIRGAALKASHLFLALTTHPHFGRWVAFAELVALAAAAIALFLRTLLRAGAPSRWSPALRLGSTAVLLCFGFSSCTSPGGLSPGGTLGQGDSALLSGDTAHGQAAGTYYYHSNHIQSTSVVTDASGNEVTRMVYLPFGEVSPANSAGADTVTAKFTGQEYDDSFGLYYYNARYYDPALGRFLSPDSIVPDLWNLQSFNRYSYVLNNPLKYIDPTGHFNLGTFLTGVGLAVAGVLILAVSAVAAIVAPVTAALGITTGQLGWGLLASGILGIAASFKMGSDGFQMSVGVGGDGSGWSGTTGSTTTIPGGGGASSGGDGADGGALWGGEVSTTYDGGYRSAPPGPAAPWTPPISRKTPSGSGKAGLRVGLWTEVLYRNTPELTRLYSAIEELNEPGCACALRGGYGWASAPWDDRVIVLQLARWVGWKGSNGWTNPAGVIFIDPDGPNFATTIAHEAGHFRWPYLGHGHERRFRAQRICGVSLNPDFWALEGLNIGACPWVK
jgi:RHS repeat-associated protein